MLFVSRDIGRFRLDRALILAMLCMAIFVGGRGWLAEHPEHDPWAPLNLNDPPGWATQRKLAALRNDPAECRAVLERSEVMFETLPDVGEGNCRVTDRIALTESPFAPSRPTATCAVNAALELWLRSVQSAAEQQLGTQVDRIEHFGTYNCRRVYGRDSGRWSEHARGNAIDIAAFVLKDGRRISVVEDWAGGTAEATFLHRVRDEACKVFGTVLSPDYNSAHADHLHLDQAFRGFGGVCR